MKTLPQDQRTLWNGPAGQSWIESQALLDRLFKPFEDLLAEAVAKRPGAPVLDVGCGTGATTLAAARALGANGHSVGVDISEPMISVARARAAREGAAAHFISADAQSHVFEPGFGTFISRFGVMFFDDPVRAFANLRRAAGTGAETRFIAWRSAAENPLMTTAERTAAPLLPALPPRRPDAPGQFAFADPERVRHILDESGWRDIDIRPLDVPCSLSVSDLDHYITRMGPVGLLLRESDEATRAQVTTAVRAAFEPYVQAGEVRFVAACWMIVARVGQA